MLVTPCFCSGRKKGVDEAKVEDIVHIQYMPVVGQTAFEARQAGVCIEYQFSSQTSFVSSEEAVAVVLHGNGDTMSDKDDGHGDEKQQQQQQDEIEREASLSYRRLTAVAAH